MRKAQPDMHRVIPGVHGDPEYRSSAVIEPPFVAWRHWEVGPHRPASWSAVVVRYARREMRDGALGSSRGAAVR